MDNTVIDVFDLAKKVDVANTRKLHQSEWTFQTFNMFLNRKYIPTYFVDISKSLRVIFADLDNAVANVFDLKKKVDLATLRKLYQSG